MDRRTVPKTAAALAATGIAPHAVRAQTGFSSRPARPLPPRDELLISGAIVLSIDDKIGDFAPGDVHVRDGAIVAVAQNIDAAGIPVFDARDMICMPGFVDTHWHLWTSLCRSIIRIDDPKRSYFPVTNALGRHYTPEDSYRSVRLGLAEGLTAGATTVHNWAHNIRSSEHADAELRAMRDTGIRGRLAYGTPQGGSEDEPMDLAGLARIQREWMPNDGTLTLGICSRNVGDSTNRLRGNITIETAHKDWGGARALGLPITMHTSGPSPIKLLEDAGLPGPDVQLVHPLLTTAEERKILAARGTSSACASCTPCSCTASGRKSGSLRSVSFGSPRSMARSTSTSRTGPARLPRASGRIHPGAHDRHQHDAAIRSVRGARHLRPAVQCGHGDGGWTRPGSR
jgi:hypothetical protein